MARSATSTVAPGLESDELTNLLLGSRGRDVWRVMSNHLARRTVNQPLVIVPRDLLAIEGLASEVLEQLVRPIAVDLDLVEHGVSVCGRAAWRHPHVVVRASAFRSPRLLVAELVAREQQKLEVRRSKLGQQLREARLVGRAVASVGRRVSDQDGFCFVLRERNKLALHVSLRVINRCKRVIAIRVELRQFSSGARPQRFAIAFT